MGARAILICASVTATLAAQGLAPQRIAAAEPDPPDDAALTQLRLTFREGVALMAAQDWANALAKFKRVAQVKMNAQIAFNIAECERELGKLVSALGNYRVALAQAKEPGTEKVAEAAPGRIEALLPRIAHLKITRKEPTPNARATIELDGAELGPSQIGSEILVDPGDHTMRVMVGGKPVRLSSVRLREGESRAVEIEIPAMVDVAAGDGSKPAVTAGGLSSGQTAGIVLMVLGGASLVVGGAGIGVRQQAIGELDDACGGDSSCPASAQSAYDRGRLGTGLSEIFFPLGAVSMVTGAVLFVVTKPKPASAEGATTALSIGLGAPDGRGPGARAQLRF